MYFIGCLEVSGWSGRGARVGPRRNEFVGSVQVESPSWPPKFTQTWIQTCMSSFMCMYLHILHRYICLYEYTQHVFVFTHSANIHMCTADCPLPFFLPRAMAQLYGKDTPHFTTRRIPSRALYSACMTTGSISIPVCFH